MRIGTCHLIIISGFLATLLGCSATLAGDWEGTLTCTNDGETIKQDVELELEAEGAGAFSGKMELSYSDDVVRAEYEFDVTVEKEKAAGAQTLEFELDCDDAIIFIEDEVFIDSCSAIEVEDDEWDADWDGKDELEIDDNGCEGELER